MISEQIKELLKRGLYLLPYHLSKKQIHIDNDGLNAVKQSMRQNFYTGWRSESSYTKERYEDDLRQHLYKRLDNDRMRIVPWLDNARHLEGSKILEIGCGTGSSSVALAEQGAMVTGVDIDEGVLSVAKDRCRVYRLKAEFRMLNATEIKGAFSDARFDFIVFFACLEHMAIEERLTALKDAWDMLENGGLLVIVETPNRLWYFDSHTSQLPFFHWLPNELAFKYSRFSPREGFRELYREYNTTSEGHFLRRGRGVSFHEFEIAIKPASALKVVSSLCQFEGIRYWIRQSRLERRYKSFLRKVCPMIHEGFFDSSLDLIIEKD